MSDSSDEKVVEPKAPSDEALTKPDISNLTANLEDVKLETAKETSLFNIQNNIKDILLND
jgi:hypothetical protein